MAYADVLMLYNSMGNIENYLKLRGIDLTAFAVLLSLIGKRNAAFLSLSI